MGGEFQHWGHPFMDHHLIHGWRISMNGVQHTPFQQVSMSFALGQSAFSA